MSVTIIREIREKSCRWCGSQNLGQGCPYSPTGFHEKIPVDSNSCNYCGSSAYGKGCPFSPNGVHVHGHGVDKCIWCGSKKVGKGCPYSPTGNHEK